jgi:TolB-like protein/DNA-binding SARP family transcriptional activator/Tfp pilus assembly protein PilF
VLSLRLLGEIELVRDGKPLALPQSKKTRALLAYLALNQGPHRRERLCEMFYEIPDDPRAALRWSLSRLRSLVDEPGLTRIVATRDTVIVVRAQAAKDLDTLSTGQLAALAALFRAELLEGNDLSNLPDFQAWCLAERENARRLQSRILSLLVARHQNDAEAALPHARRLIRIDPLNESAQAAILGLLMTAGRREEAEQQFDAAQRLFRDIGADSENRLAAAWREARQSAAGPPSTGPRVQIKPDAAAAPAMVAREISDIRLTGRPSIAVLPFANISGDPEQEYFADGMTEEIITGLSRVRWFFVTARTSSFTYKGQAIDVKRVASELGVRYILEGSVRKEQGRVRINVRLSDGETGTQLWAQRYDRELANVFDLQDEITATIVGALEPVVGKVERQRARSKKPGNLDAWEIYQHGMSCLYLLTKQDLETAQRLFERAIDQDPELGPACSGIAEALYYETVYGFAESARDNRERAIVSALRAVTLDSEDAGAHCTLGRTHYMRREHAAAIIELTTALDLNPSLALAHYGMGAVLVFSGRSEEAVPHLKSAMRLSPYDPNMGSVLVRLADAMYFTGRCEEAVEWARKAIQQPNFQWSRHAVLIAALGQCGRLEEGRRALEQVVKLRPDFSLSFVKETHLLDDPENIEHYLEGLRKVGLPP